jgi:hypothetical protein
VAFCSNSHDLGAFINQNVQKFDGDKPMQVTFLPKSALAQTRFGAHKLQKTVQAFGRDQVCFSGAKSADSIVMEKIQHYQSIVDGLTPENTEIISVSTEKKGVNHWKQAIFFRRNDQGENDKTIYEFRRSWLGDFPLPQSVHLTTHPNPTLMQFNQFNRGTIHTIAQNSSKDMLYLLPMVPNPKWGYDLDSKNGKLHVGYVPSIETSGLERPHSKKKKILAQLWELQNTLAHKLDPLVKGLYIGEEYAGPYMQQIPIGYV